MEPQAEKTAQSSDYTLFAGGLPSEAQERRARLALNRSQPDSEHRAYLQELAIAVADELELRQAVDDKMSCEYADADSAQDEAQRLAQQAAIDAEQPLQAAFRKATAYVPSRWDTASMAALLGGDKLPVLTRKTLNWAIAEGILPQGTTALPDTDAQFLALARWKPTE